MPRFSRHKISELRRAREKSQIVSESYRVVLSGENTKNCRHAEKIYVLLRDSKNDVAFGTKCRSQYATIGKSKDLRAPKS